MRLQQVADAPLADRRRTLPLNWVVLDSDWEAELCRVAESPPRVKAYVKKHNLGLEVPYRHGSEVRHYRPDFIVVVDDERGTDDLLHLVSRRGWTGPSSTSTTRTGRTG